MNKKVEHDAQHDSKRENHGRAAFESNDPGTVQNAMRYRRRKVRKCGDRSFKIGRLLARSGAGEDAIASWCESETCSELTTERSIGRMLQLQVRGCHVRQLSLATAEYVWAAACCWQQGRTACRLAAASSHWEQFAAPASQMAVCRRGKNQRDRKEVCTGAADRKRWMGGGSQHA